MSMKQQQRFNPHNVIAVGLLALFVGIVVIAILTLMGPSVGNVFSNTVSSAPSQGLFGVPSTGASGAGNVASAPSEVSDTSWDEEMSSLPPGEQMVVKNGQITILVEDTQTAIAQVTQIALDHGGYVLTSQTWTEEQTGAVMTITVEAVEFETAMRQLRDIAVKVESESTSGEDVTAEYVDLESQLRTLEATGDRLRAFLDQAQTVDEALEVSEELTGIEAQIEQVKGRMEYLARRAAYSRITINLSMPAPVAPTPTPTPWGLEPAFESAVGVQRGLLRFLAESIVWLGVVVGPYLLVGSVLFFGMRTIARRVNSGSRQTPSHAAPGEE